MHRRELRFPRTILEPIRHVLGRQAPGICFDDVLAQIGATPEQFETPEYTLDGEQLYGLLTWIGPATG